MWGWAVGAQTQFLPLLDAALCTPVTLLVRKLRILFFFFRLCHHESFVERTWSYVVFLRSMSCEAVGRPDASSFSQISLEMCCL